MKWKNALPHKDFYRIGAPAYTIKEYGVIFNYSSLLGYSGSPKKKVHGLL